MKDLMIEAAEKLEEDIPEVPFEEWMELITTYWTLDDVIHYLEE